MSILRSQIPPMITSKNSIRTIDTYWLKLMVWGRIIGCHQIPERSFFYKGRQFPVCARCTGVIVAYLFALPMFFIHPIQPFSCLLLCTLMFLDWFIQYLKIKLSTNTRRLITGFIGGYGFLTLQLYLIKYFFLKIITFF